MSYGMLENFNFAKIYSSTEFSWLQEKYNYENCVKRFSKTSCLKVLLWSPWCEQSSRFSYNKCFGSLIMYCYKRMEYLGKQSIFIISQARPYFVQIMKMSTLSLLGASSQLYWQFAQQEVISHSLLGS